MHLTKASLENLERHSYTLGEIYTLAESYPSLKFTADNWGSRHFFISHGTIFLVELYGGQGVPLTKEQFAELSKIPAFKILKEYSADIHGRQASENEKQLKAWANEVLDHNVRNNQPVERWW